MRFTYFWPWWAVVFGLVIMAGVTVYTYLHLKRPLRRRLRLLFIGLRILAASVLLFCLLEPVLVERKNITPPTNLLILADTSQSMQITDANLNGELVPRLALANQLLFDSSSLFLPDLNKRFETHLYQFDKQSQQISDTSEQLEVEGGLTDIASSIRNAAKEWRGQQLAGIILITDGAHNASTFTIDDLTEVLIPIYPIGVGNPEAPKDLRIAKVEVSPIVYMEHEVPIRITVQHTGYSGSQVRLSLRQFKSSPSLDEKLPEIPSQNTERVVDAVSITLTDQPTQVVEFTLVPRTEGTFQYIASLPTLSDELTKENNNKAFPIKVVKTKLRVLYIDGRPRWEYTFLKRSLERDPDVQSTCMILSSRTRSQLSKTRLARADRYYPQKTDLSQTPRFPKTLQELLAYDVLIVGDVLPNLLTSAQQQAIIDFVEKRGKAIIFLGGRNSLGINGFRKTGLADIVPILIPRNGCAVRDEDFSLKLTQSGLYHPITRLENTQAKVEAIWRDLPTLSRRFGGFQLKGGATTLAEYRLSKGDTPVPVIIFQRSGLGKSLLIAAEGIWNWRFGVWSFKDEDNTYPRFWAQTVRWMATRTDAKQVNVTTNLSTYSVGDEAQVTVFAYDESYQPLNDAEIKVEIIPPDEKSFQLRTSPQPANLGAYAAQFKTNQKGNYHIRASGKQGDISLGEDSTAIFVQSQLAELENPQLHEPLLKQLASKTDGIYTPIADAASLTNKIKGVQEPVFVTQERDLWDTPLILILVVGILGTEWFLRKRRGLV